MQRWKVSTPILRGAAIGGPRVGAAPRGNPRAPASVPEAAARRRCQVAVALDPEPRASLGTGLARHPPEAGLEGGVAEAEGRDRARVDRRGAPRPRPTGRSASVSGRGQAELHRRAGDVPGDVLAADEVVGRGMVERVGLAEPAVGARAATPRGAAARRSAPG